METTVLTGGQGQEFQVELESFPSSGARWYCQPHSSVLQLIREETRVQDQSIGAGALQVFTFRCDQAGTYTLVFHLKRVWEPSPRQEREFKVEVR